MPKATYSQDINFTSDKLPTWAGISEIHYSRTSMPYPFMAACTPRSLVIIGA
jgi:hypothetical protein